MRVKETAYVKGWQRTGGKPSAAKKQKHKSASAMADAAAQRAVRALAAKRNREAVDEDQDDELVQEEEEAEQEEEISILRLDWGASQAALLRPCGCVSVLSDAWSPLID